MKVTQAQSSSSRTLRKKLKGGNFTGCITNLYTRRSGNLRNLFSHRWYPPAFSYNNMNLCFFKNLIWHRPGQSFIPVDLSTYSLAEDRGLGPCRLHPQPHTEVLPAPAQKIPETQKPVSAKKPLLLQDHDNSSIGFMISYWCRSFLRCVRLRLRQAASVNTREPNRANTSSLSNTAGSVTPCRKRTWITGNGRYVIKHLEDVLFIRSLEH